ncbi:helix-turn-helix transcriptional regulator [Burkholderia orbicola]|uniref:helix-turn-helix domain-containing protein n=1 Tax=Burkholderia orbicola TaxID=2978683 RepID=UPI002FDF109D
MNTENERGFGDRLDELMQDNSLYAGNRGQSALARASGVPQPTISRILKKKAAPEMETVAKLAVALNVTCEWLLTERGPKYIKDMQQSVIVNPKPNVTDETHGPKISTLINLLQNLQTEVSNLLSYVQGLPSVSEETKHSQDMDISSVRATGAAAADLLKEGRHEDEQHGKHEIRPPRGSKT